MPNSSSVGDREIMVKIVKNLHDYEEQRMKNSYYRAEKDRTTKLIEQQVEIDIQKLTNPPYSGSDFLQSVLFFAIVIVFPVVCWVFYLEF